MTRAYIVGIDGRWYAFAGDDNPNVNRVWSIGEPLQAHGAR